MNNYIICTDSACDLSAEVLKEWGVPFCCLSFRFDGEDAEYSNSEMDTKTFYNKMRDGGFARTSAVNSDSFYDLFSGILKEEKDVLYLGFSSGLSTTYNSGRIAAEQLRAEYPDRKIFAVDTLSASAGQALMLYLALEKQKNGATIEETAAYVESLVPRLVHWVTVDDLVYLKRGGRISPTVAFVGNTLGLKPLIRVDNEGKLESASKARGRKNAIDALADKYGELAKDPADGTVFISHGDCLADAEKLKAILKEKHGADVKLIAEVGPVIGAHTGPGILLITFVGKNR